jgi:hypothetical protein
MPTALANHLAEPLPDGGAELFTEDVRFSSPFADYAGRETVAHLFALIPGVFDALELRRELHGERERATVLHARIADQPADGILDERYAADGRIEQVTIMLRPYGAVRAAMGLMRDALAGGSAPPG